MALVRQVLGRRLGWVPTLIDGFCSEKAETGSDETRTCDLRRDRPVMALRAERR